jgi:hypothetical protein
VATLLLLLFLIGPACAPLLQDQLKERYEATKSTTKATWEDWSKQVRALACDAACALPTAAAVVQHAGCGVVQQYVPGLARMGQGLSRGRACNSCISPPQAACSPPTPPVFRRLQARESYDEAARSGGWWDSFSDRVACAWDNAKCRARETLGMAAVSALPRCAALLSGIRTCLRGTHGLRLRHMGHAVYCILLGVGS